MYRVFKIDIASPVELEGQLNNFYDNDDLEFVAADNGHYIFKERNYKAEDRLEDIIKILRNLFAAIMGSPPP